ncbi:GGDEF domain-containing protein [Luteibacter sp. 329MFSha]|uniref:GGDEF domain-containing protein n=1 Tax=Luteibacter sp. 329MFSha TaxID=1798239 RepID=UPI0008BD387D|nr:GGDEF domain-containing protein [Luteibacter sp. 329MFSha]SEV95250.1 diguanylate cyclase (GGDEF) domain-containing protein [Luteibacter sp. 329MFSha]
MKARIAAVAIAAAHALALLTVPLPGMAISYVFFFGVAALAMGSVVYAWTRSGTPRDRRWWLLLASLALWMTGMALSARQNYVLDNSNPAPGDSMFFYILYVLPVLVSVSSAPVAARKRWAMSIDLVLATLLGVLFYVRTFSIVSVQGAMGTQQATDVAYMLDFENACLAMAALLRYVATDRKDDHFFFRGVTAFFVTYAICGYVYNHHVALAGHPEFGTSPFDALLDLPFLALFIAAVTRQPQRHWHPPVYLVRFVQSASPTFLAMSVLGFGLMVIPGYPTLGIVGAIAAVIGIGLRGTLAQVDLVEEEFRLSRSRDELQGLVFVDSLTGLANRRALDERLLREWHRQGQQEPIALLMIDVDFFKEYNDRFGHLAGDECLRALAAGMLAHGTRAGDFIARFGGEEFAVVAPGTRPGEALALAESLRTHVESLQIAHPASPFQRLTISIGVGLAHPSSDGGPLDLLNAADRALYRAKQSGRNRVGAPDGPRLGAARADTRRMS